MPLQSPSAVADAGTGKPMLGPVAVSNLSVGFFGIQIAFALQNSNVSRIFQTLGASIDQLPVLWIAGPLAGLLIQPLVGYLSDRTWCRFGRRRPYFIVGAVASAIALVLLPSSHALWLAVPAFWLLDIALNVTMEPFRAFVGDMLHDRQRTTGYAVQSVFIGIGALVASAAPFLLSRVFRVAGDAPSGVVPDAVRWSFYIGAAALLAAVLWTVVSTREYSPRELAHYAGAQPVATRDVAPFRGFAAGLREIVHDLWHLPPHMRHLASVQFFSWSGLFMLWIYATPTVALRQFAGAVPGTAAYNAAGDWVGVLFATYNGIAAVYAFLIPSLAARIGGHRLHAAHLVAGAAGLAALYFLSGSEAALGAMIGIGIAWASILTLPYALLCRGLPETKLGLYMGIFNFFIVLPQLAVSGLMGVALRGIFPGNPSGAMLMAAASLLIAAILAWGRIGNE